MHSTVSPKYVLPISEVDVEELLNAGDVASWASQATTEQLASVLVLLLSRRMAKNDNMAGQTIMIAFDRLSSNVDSPDSLDGLRQNLLAEWDLEAFRAVIIKLQSYGIALLEPGDDVPNRWTADSARLVLDQRSPFTRSVTLNKVEYRLTDDQYRLQQKIEFEPDEPLDIQAYAGFGKTHLVSVLAQTIPSGKKGLILAFTAQQLRAVCGKVPPHKALGMTFSELSKLMWARCPSLAAQDIEKRSNNQYNISDSDLSDLMGFHPVGYLSGATVANTARRTVMSFCNTRDDQISYRHLPRMTDRLTQVQKTELLTAADRLWRETIFPSHVHKALPLRAYHRIKQLSLMSEVLPEEFYTVIVDESHEIPGPLIDILDRSPQGVVTLGDQFQKLSGPVAGRSQAIRKNALSMSVRAGEQVERILNPLLALHPDSNGLPLIGSRIRRTFIEFYETMPEPVVPTAVLVSDDWELFEWFQRFAHQRAKFTVLPESFHSFKALVLGCIGLYQRSERSNHPFLFRYPSWDELYKGQSHNAAFGRIARLIKRGYGESDFENSLSKMSPPGDRVPLILGQVSHTRSREFDGVVLTRNLFPQAPALSWRESLSTIYTGASRTRHALYLPREYEEWLSEAILQASKTTSQNTNFRQHGGPKRH